MSRCWHGTQAAVCRLSDPTTCKETIINIKRNMLAIALTASLFVAGHAQSGQRNVYVNGEYMNTLGLVVLDAMNCGQAVPSGRYWINWDRQTWGYEGRAKSSPLPDCTQRAGLPQQARQAQSGRSGGSWEDRVHENLCARNGHCGVDIVVNPAYQ